MSLNQSLSFDDLQLKLRKYAPYALLVLAAFAVYANVYHNEFLYDDDHHIVQNQFLRGWENIPAIFMSSATGGAHIPGGFYRPLQILAFFFVYQIAGLSTIAFHLLNVCLHAACGCILYRLGRKLNFNPWPCFAGTLLWVVHPVLTEAVTYMSGAADLLYSMFCMLGIMVLLPDFAPKKLWKAAVFFVLAVLSKEPGVIFPLLMMVCLFYISPDRWKPKTYLLTWPFWLAAGFYILLREQFLHFNHFQLYWRDDLYAYSILCRIGTFVAMVPNYFALFVWPVDLHMDRGYPIVTEFTPKVLLGSVMLACMALHIVYAKEKGRILSWAILWFFAAYALFTGILKPVNSLLQEHWMYLPSAGLILGTTVYVARLIEGKQLLEQAAIALVGVLTIVLGVATLQQNTVWKDGITFYKNIIGKGEYSSHVFNNLGTVYSNTGKYDLALEQYQLAMKYSGDHDAQPHHNYGLTLLRMGLSKEHIDEAIFHFKRATELDQYHYASYVALTNLYAYIGDKKESARYAKIRDQMHELLAPGSEQHPLLPPSSVRQGTDPQGTAP
jgi:tetratricopeptide (TPR) repeat protein